MIQEDRIKQLIDLIRTMKDAAKRKALYFEGARQDEAFRYWTGYWDALDAAEDQLIAVVNHL